MSKQSELGLSSSDLKKIPPPLPTDKGSGHKGPEAGASDKLLQNAAAYIADGTPKKKTIEVTPSKRRSGTSRRSPPSRSRTPDSRRRRSYGRSRTRSSSRPRSRSRSRSRSYSRRHRYDDDTSDRILEAISGMNSRLSRMEDRDRERDARVAKLEAGGVASSSGSAPLTQTRARTVSPGSSPPPPPPPPPPPVEPVSDALYPKEKERKPCTHLMDPEAFNIGAFHVYSPDVLSDSVLAKIANDEFVEFYDVLYNTKSKFNMETGDGDKPSLVFEEVSRRQLSFPEWSLAFDKYSYAYTRVFPSADTGLRLYGLFIKKLAAQGNNVWARYDDKFRRERKALRIPWCIVRQDLRQDVSCTLPVQLEGDPSLQAPQTPKTPSLPRGPGPRKPKATFRRRVVHRFMDRCHRYNRESPTRCVACRYKHKCYNCDAAHPFRRCPRPEAAKSTTGQPQP